MLDLRTIPIPDLKALIMVCDSMGKRGNRFFEDQFVILSRVALGMHEMKEMNEYDSADLVEAIEYLKIAIDGLGHLSSDHPGKMFLHYSLTAAHAELERRNRKETLRAVK